MLRFSAYFLWYGVEKLLKIPLIIKWLQKLLPNLTFFDRFGKNSMYVR